MKRVYELFQICGKANLRKVAGHDDKYEFYAEVKRLRVEPALCAQIYNDKAVHSPVFAAHIIVVNEYLQAQEANLI